MAGGMLLAIKCDLRVGLRGTRAGITEVKMGRGSPWAVPLLWMLPQPRADGTRSHRRDRCRSNGSPSTASSTTWRTRRMPSGAARSQLARTIVEGAPLSVKAAKASVLAAMDLGCEQGLVEANRLHVGDLCQPRRHRRSQERLPKSESRLAGQIGGYSRRYAFLMPSKIRSSVRRASFSTASLLSNLNHSIVQFSAPSTKIRNGTISMSARISPARRASRKSWSQYLA